MNNFHPFHTVWLGRNTIKKIHCSAFPHCDALLEDYKIIRTKNEPSSQYRDKKNSFQLNDHAINRVDAL